MKGTRMRACLLLVAASLAGSFALGGEIPIPERPAPQQPGQGKPVVAVFDFVSAYDGGRMGKFVAKNLWAKLDRSRKCVLIERDDVNGVVEAAKFVAGFDDSSEKIVKFATEELGVTHVIWGVVEQVDTTGPVSERSLRISGRAAGVEDKGKKLLVDVSVGVKNQREIQLATKEILRLFFKIAKPKPDVGPEEEKRWRTGPNLVKNPGFETGAAHPEFWEPISDDPKHYQHRCVSWVKSPEGKGKCIRFTVPKDIAATYGVAYYGDPISIQDGQIYRFSIRVRSDGPTVKIFLKHYRFFPPGPNEKKGQWRETRHAPMNCKGEKGQWQTYTRDFRPHRDDHDGKFDPTITKVELYAYWPKGVVYYDDVVLKKIKSREKK